MMKHFEFSFLSVSWPMRYGEIGSVGATQWVAPTTVVYRSLFGFEVAPGEITRVADVPETVDLGRQAAERHIQIGEIDTVDRQAGHIPRVDKCAQVAGLPAESAGSVFDERSCNSGIHRAAGAAGRRCGSARRCSRRPN